jgi:hypothetical protein
MPASSAQNGPASAALASPPSGGTQLPASGTMQKASQKIEPHVGVTHVSPLGGLLAPVQKQAMSRRLLSTMHAHPGAHGAPLHIPGEAWKIPASSAQSRPSSPPCPTSIGLASPPSGGNAPSPGDDASMSASGWCIAALSDSASATFELDELELQPTLNAERDRATHAGTRGLMPGLTQGACHAYIPGGCGPRGPRRATGLSASVPCLVRGTPRARYLRRASATGAGSDPNACEDRIRVTK